MEHIQVDLNSVTIRREDIPDSLFTLPECFRQSTAAVK
jgi:hypothetical protein